MLFSGLNSHITPTKSLITMAEKMFWKVASWKAFPPPRTIMLVSLLSWRWIADARKTLTRYHQRVSCFSRRIGVDKLFSTIFFRWWNQWCIYSFLFPMQSLTKSQNKANLCAVRQEKSGPGAHSPQISDIWQQQNETTLKPSTIRCVYVGGGVTD